MSRPFVIPVPLLFPKPFPVPLISYFDSGSSCFSHSSSVFRPLGIVRPSPVWPSIVGHRIVPRSDYVQAVVGSK